MKSVKDKRGAVPPTEAVEPPFSSSAFPSAISSSQWANPSRYTRGEAGEATTDGLLFRSSSMSTLPTCATGTTCSASTPLRSCASGNSSIGYWPLSMSASEIDSVYVECRGEDETSSSVIACSSSSPVMWSANEENAEEVQEEKEGWDGSEEEPKRKKKKGKTKVKKIAKRSWKEKKDGDLHRISDALSAVPCWNSHRIHDDGVGLASHASSSSASDPVWWKCKKLRKKVLGYHPIRVEPHCSLSTDSLRPPFGSVSSSSSFASSPSSTPYASRAVEGRAAVVSKPHATSSGSRAHVRIPPPRGGGGGHPQSSFSATVEALAARAQRASSYFDPVLPEPSSLPSLDAAAAKKRGDEREASYYISELHRQVAEMRAAEEEADEEEEEVCSSDASSSSDDLRMEEEEEDEWDAVYSTERARREKRRLAHQTKEKLLKREREVLQKEKKKKRMASLGQPLIPSPFSAPGVASSSTASSLMSPFFSRAQDGGAEEKRGGGEVSVELWAGADSRVTSDRLKRNRKGEPQRKRGVKKKRHASGGGVARDSFVLLQDFEPWEETLEWEEENEEGQEYSFSASQCDEYMDESDYYLSSFDGGSSCSEDGSRSRSSNTNNYNSSGEDEDEDGDRVCVVMEYSLEDMERMEESSLTKKRRKKKDKKIIKEKIRKDALHRKVRPRKCRRVEREQPPSFTLAPLPSPSALPPPFSLPPTRSKLCQQEKSLEQLFDCTTAH